MSKMIRTNSNAQNNANISNEIATGSGHHHNNRAEQPRFFEETFLPQSVRSDYLSAAEETEYEISVNTRRVYNTSFNVFSRYCAEHQLQALPADPRSVISFIGHQKN